MSSFFCGYFCYFRKSGGSINILSWWKMEKLLIDPSPSPTIRYQGVPLHESRSHPRRPRANCIYSWPWQTPKGSLWEAPLFDSFVFNFTIFRTSSYYFVTYFSFVIFPPSQDKSCHKMENIFAIWWQLFDVTLKSNSCDTNITIRRHQI